MIRYHFLTTPTSQRLIRTTTNGTKIAVQTYSKEHGGTQSAMNQVLMASIGMARTQIILPMASYGNLGKVILILMHNRR